MSWLKKWIIISLLISNVFAVQMNCYVGRVTAADASSGQTKAGFRTLKAEPISKEKVALQNEKTITTDTYLMPDGTKQKIAYTLPVNYKDKTGNWQKIDSNFTEAIENSRKTYRTEKNSFKLDISSDLVNRGVKISADSGQLTMSIGGISDGSSKYDSFNAQKFNKKAAAATVPELSKNRLNYKNIAPNIDIVYDSLSSGLKENIVLNQPTTQSIFSFNLQASNLSFKKENGAYYFYDSSTLKNIFSIPKMVMWDSQGGSGSEKNVYSDDIVTSITPGNNGQLIMSIKPSQSWLRDAARVYPVTIDPTIVGNLDYGQDTYIQEGYPSLNMWVNTDMYVGRHPYKYRTRSLVPFNLPDLTNAKFINATFTTKQNSCYYSPASTDARVGAFITGDYDFKQVTWNNQPSFLALVGSSDYCGVGDINIDVTPALVSWFNDGNHYGSKIGSLGFVAYDEAHTGYRNWDTASNTTAADTQGPHLIINYTDYNGGYAAGNLPGGLLVDDEISVPVLAANYGRNTWTASNHKFSYRVYTPWGALVQEGIRTALPFDIGPGGRANFDALLKLPSSPGDYQIRWEIVRDDGLWFSSEGISPYVQSIYVADYPEYSAFYSDFTLPTASTAGEIMQIPIVLGNASRYDWTPDSYKLGYHWFNVTENKYYFWNDTFITIPQTIPKHTGTGNMTADVLAPMLPGVYRLEFDMYSNSSYKFFSDFGVAMGSKQLTITPFSISSKIHQGLKDYYPIVGPVDISSGSLSITETDMTVPTAYGPVGITRTYSSADPNPTYTTDSSGYIKKWLFNGPYDPGNDPWYGWRHDYTNHEIMPNEGTVSSGNNWYKIEDQTSDPGINVENILDEYGVVQGQKINYPTIYSHTYIFAPADGNYNCYIAGDEAVNVWLNSNEVVSRFYGIDGIFDDNISLSLKKGWNRLMIKWVEWSFHSKMIVKIARRDGTNATELKFALNNPKIFGGDGVMGKGWTTNLDERLYTDDVDNIYHKDATGAVEVYTRKSDETYQRPAGSNADLTYQTFGDVIVYTLRYTDGSSTQFHSDGTVQFKRNSAGNSQSYTYYSNLDGTPTYRASIVGGNGSFRSVWFSYYPDGRLKSSKNAMFMDGDLYDESYLYEYTNNLLTKVIDPSGNFKEFAYSPSGKMISFKDKRGSISKVAYTSGKVSSITDALGGRSQISYGAEVVVRDALGRPEKFQLSKAGQIIQHTDAKSNATCYQYDSNYNVAFITPLLPESDKYFYKWRIEYDTNSNIIKTTDPNGNVNLFSYTNNLLTKSTDATGASIIYSYSTDGLLTAETDADGKTMRYEYGNSAPGLFTWRNLKIKEIDPTGNFVSYSYNYNGDLITRTSAEGYITSYQLDDVGRKIKETSNLGNVTTYEYDKMSRLVSLVIPDGTVLKYEFDANGNKVKEINGDGTYKSYEYDLLDRLIKVTDEIGATTSYAYDKVGNKIRMIDANGVITTYAYDALNQLISQNESEEASTTASYDRNGNLSRSVDANGVVNTMTYDKSGRLVKQKNSAETDNYYYNKNNLLTKSVNTDSQTALSQSATMSYTKGGKPYKLSTSSFGPVTRSYNTLGNMSKIATDSTSVNLQYDKDNNVKNISTSLNNGATTGDIDFIWDGEGKLTSLVRADGGSIKYAYNKLGLVTKINNLNSAGSVLSTYGYSYDKKGNPTSIIYNNRTSTSYKYDNRSQLVADDSAQYTYDLAGNRLSKVDSSGSTTYEYKASGDKNRLQKVSEPQGMETVYEYDGTGNITKKIDAQKGTTTYIYNNENKFSKALLPDGKTVEYQYDPTLGLLTCRTEISSDGAKKVTNFSYDGYRLLSESDENGAITIQYIWDEKENLISFAIPNSSGVYETFSYLKNAKNDITGIANAQGQVVARYAYDAWGKVTTARTESVSSVANIHKLNPRLYSGYWYDSSLNMYFLKTRLYDPSLGRYISKDEILASSLPSDQNPYIYCRNNPLKFTDPSGKFAALAIGAVLGSGVGVFTAPAWVPVVFVGIIVIGVGVAAWELGQYVGRLTRDDVTTNDPGPTTVAPPSPGRPNNDDSGGDRNRRWSVRVRGPHSWYNSSNEYCVSFVSLEIYNYNREVLRVAIDAHPLGERLSGFDDQSFRLTHLNIDTSKIKTHIFYDSRTGRANVVIDNYSTGRRITNRISFPLKPW